MPLKTSDTLWVEQITEPRDLQPGDWFEFKLGTPRFVIYNDGKGIRYSSPKWYLSDSRYENYKDLHEWTYLGRGKRRWWWKYLPVILRENVVPFTKPESLWWLS